MSASYLDAVDARSSDASCGAPATGALTAADDASLTALTPYFTTCRVKCAVFADSGRGLGCLESVPEKATLLAIPLDCCWTAEAARKCPELAALGTEVLDAITPENLIALHLLIVRAQPTAPATDAPAGDRCRWQHMQVLEGTPIEVLWDWSDAELREHLTGSKWGLAPGWAKADVLADLDEWSHYPPLAALFAAHKVRAESLLWAHKVVNSRMLCFGSGDGTRHVIGPGVDMLNHSLDAPLSNDDVALDAPSDALVVRASRAYAAGEEACFAYSAVSNGRLLMSGGFVLPSNPWDSVELALTLPLHEPSLTVYASLAAELDKGAGSGGAFAEAMPCEFVQPVESEDGSPPTAFVLHMRLAKPTLAAQLKRVVRFYQAEHLGRIAMSEGTSTLTEEVTLGQIDAPEGGVRPHAAARLRSGVAEMLAAYRKELAENEFALATLEREASMAGCGVEATGARRRRQALHVVVGEQRILRDALGLLDAEVVDVADP